MSEVEQIIEPNHPKENSENIYRKLAKPLPREGIQEAATKEFKGYDSIGFGYQWIVNRLNEALGIDKWRVLEENIGEPIQIGKMTDITKKITIQIGYWQDKSDFIVEAERWSYGGHSAKLLADAHKGATTNGLKKAAAMFGVGREAYEATLDEDNRNIRAVYEDMLPEKQKQTDEWINKIQSSKDKKELAEIGNKIKDIKSDRNMVLILRSEYNKKLLSFKDESKPTKPEPKPATK